MKGKVVLKRFLILLALLELTVACSAEIAYLIFAKTNKQFQFIREFTENWAIKGRYQTDLLPVKVNQQWGYIDRAGKIVIKPQYQLAGPFSEGLAPIAQENGSRYYRFGYIDTKGRLLIPAKFDDADRFSEGLARIGFGKTLQIFRWQDNRFETFKYYKITRYGYINRKGTEVIKPRFSQATPFSEGLAAVCTHDTDNPAEKKCGYIDKSGRLVIAPKYQWAEPFSEGLAAVGFVTGAKPHFKWAGGYINKAGKIAIPFRYCINQSFSEGLAAVSKAPAGKDCVWIGPDGRIEPNLFGFINPRGRLIIEAIFLKALPFSEGLAQVWPQTKILPSNWSGYIGRDGEFVIKPSKGNRGLFREGLAAFCPVFNRTSQTQKCGYIDTTGQFVIQPRFDGLAPFFGGIAPVGHIQNDEFYLGYIDKTGRYLWLPTK